MVKLDWDLIREKYNVFGKYTEPLREPTRRIIGRDHEIEQVMNALHSPAMPNVVLKGAAGSGKTEIARAVGMRYANEYAMVSLKTIELLNARDGIAAGKRLSDLVDQIVDYSNTYDEKIILFIDEMHLLVKGSADGFEALKPILADAGSGKVEVIDDDGRPHLKKKNAILIVGATTFEEYDEYVRKNDALNQRFKQVIVDELDYGVVHNILRNAVNQNLVNVAVSDRILDEIIELTDRYMLDQYQPRKSLQLLDYAIGTYLNAQDHGKLIEFDEGLLKKSLHDMLGVDLRKDINVDKFRDYLNSHVFGQRTAVDTFADRLELSIAGLNDPTRPLASFLFVGPTGVGKTEVAKRSMEYLYGSNHKMIRFDMAEYSEASSVDSADQFREALADKVINNPSGIILFDEIEKARHEIIRLMLAILDDGELTDKYGRKVSFLNEIIIMTSNAGADTFRDVNHYEDVNDKTMAKYKDTIKEALSSRDQFPPELLNRFDDVVLFSPLSNRDKYKIVRLDLAKVCQRAFDQHGIMISFDGSEPRNEQTNQIMEKDVTRIEYFLVRENNHYDTNSGGGREISRKIDQEITTKIAQYVNRHPDEKDIAVRLVGKLAIEDPASRLTNAHIEVAKRVYESDY